MPWLTKLKKSFMTEVARELKTSRELQLAHLENHLKEIRCIRRERKERSPRTRAMIEPVIGHLKSDF